LGTGDRVTLITGALIGLLLGAVLRMRSDLLAEGLALPLLVIGGLLILSSRSPLETVTALLVATYVVALRPKRVRRS
jgi:hypothetical protein